MDDQFTLGYRAALEEAADVVENYDRQDGGCAEAILALPAPDLRERLAGERITMRRDYAEEVTPNGNPRIENITGLFSDRQASHIKTQIDLAFDAGWFAALAALGVKE